MEVVRLNAANAATAATELESLYSSGPIDPAGLAKALSDADFVLLVARANEDAVGYLHGTLMHRVDGGRMLLVYDLEVAQSAQRSGVGTALMEEARRIGRTAGTSETWLVTEGDNTPANAFYEKLGGTAFAALGYEWREA